MVKLSLSILPTVASVKMASIPSPLGHLAWHGASKAHEIRYSMIQRLVRSIMQKLGAESYHASSASSSSALLCHVVLQILNRPEAHQGRQIQNFSRVLFCLMCTSCDRTQSGDGQSGQPLV